MIERPAAVPSVAATDETIPLIDGNAGPILVFGGPYSNLEATRAVLAAARRLGIKPERIICTGDLAAYCGDPEATITLVRDSGIAVVQGNCDEQIGLAADDCGCGFPQGGTCERLSAAWFAFANRTVSGRHRPWLMELPKRIDIAVAGARIAVIHGGAEVNNRFVFATTPVDVKRGELDLAGADGIIGGHCGIPFTEIVDGRLWHNAGVVGMPANDGTSRVWYSTLAPARGGLEIAHHVLDYDVGAAQASMLRAGLPPEYRLALSSGIWPSCDVLPLGDRERQGSPLTPGRAHWPISRLKASALASGDISRTKVLWPEAAELVSSGRAAACC